MAKAKTASKPKTAVPKTPKVVAKEPEPVEVPEVEQFVVSANYKDRDAGGWLVRSQSETVDETMLCKGLILTDVEFNKSYNESGFGCSVVAYTPKVELLPKGFQIPLNAIQLHFGRDTFYVKGGYSIDSVHRLLLNTNGEIWMLQERSDGSTPVV